MPYGPDELAADLASGHDVVATVYMECHSITAPTGRTISGPSGETEFVVDAARSMTGPHDPRHHRPHRSPSPIRR
ncbi:MAG: hypothetical protein R2715_03440 [Ilumatobacteraceae bacterium]